MGKIVGGIVGGIIGNKAAKKQAKATREAAQLAAQQVAPFRQGGVVAQNALVNALGLNGPAANNAAFQQFLNNTGFQNELRAGSQAITGNAAARGLLDSGATARALQTFGQNLAQSRFQNFLGQLQALTGIGAGAAAQSAGLIQSGLTQAAGQRAAGQLALGNAIGQAFGAIQPPPFSIGGFQFFGGPLQQFPASPPVNALAPISAPTITLQPTPRPNFAFSGG